MQDGLAGLVGEADVVEANFRGSLGQGGAASRLGAFGLALQKVFGAAQGGERTGEQDVCPAKSSSGRDSVAEQGAEAGEGTEREAAVADFIGGEPEACRRERQQQQLGTQRCPGLQPLGEDLAIGQFAHAGGEESRFALFGDEDLDHAHGGERLREAAGDGGGQRAAALINFRCMAGTEAQEGRDQGEQRQQGQGKARVDPKQSGEGQQASERGQQSFERGGAEQIAHAAGVLHDAGGKRAGGVGVEEADGQADDMLLRAGSVCGEHSLPGKGESAREGEGGERLQGGGKEDYQKQGGKQCEVGGDEDAVDEEAEGERKNEARGSRQKAEDESQRNLSAVRGQQPEDGGGTPAELRDSVSVRLLELLGLR